MKIQPFVVGPYGTDSYIVYGIEGNGCILIDAPFPLTKPIEFIKNENLELEAICLTHGHFDHILGLGDARKAFPDVPIYIAAEDYSYLEDGCKKTVDLLSSFDAFFLSRYGSVIQDMPSEYVFYGDSIGSFKVLRTPGHTKGSVSLYDENESVLFTGDTLFQGSIGRTDIGGDHRELLQSLEIIKTLPESTLLLPGHGMMSSIGKELQSNPFLS